MGAQKLTTGDLFQRIGKTERTRSAKADGVFRKLRQHMDHSAADTEMFEHAIVRDASMKMKFAARQVG